MVSDFLDSKMEPLTFQVLMIPSFFLDSFFIKLVKLDKVYLRNGNGFEKKGQQR